MSYPTKYRERTIEYRKEGHTLEESHQTFKVSISTIRRWEKRLEEEGSLEKKPLHRSYKKVNPEKLIAYVKRHPDAYQKEIAEVFGCSATAIYLAMKRLKITRKKDNAIPRAGREKSSGVSGEDQRLSHGKDSICG